MIVSFVLLTAITGLARSLTQLPTIQIDVNKSPGLSYTTPLGCALDVGCSGQGTAIKWVKFGSTAPLPNSTNTLVTKFNSGNNWQADIKFEFFTSSNQGYYLCQITAQVSQSIGVQVVLGPNAIQFGSIPAVIDISQYTIGNTLTIGCPVITCASNVTLTIFPSIAQPSIFTYVNNVSNNVQNFLVTVTSGLAGTYTLTAQGTFFDGTAYLMYSTSQTFNITGTPQQPPTTPPSGGSSTTSSAPTGASPSKGGSPGSVASIAVQLLSLVLTVTLAALLSVKL